jgi:probable HAF family extracellular repeat protein
VPVAANDLGQVVGWYETPDGGVRAFSWRSGTFTDLGTLAGGLTTTAIVSTPESPSDFAVTTMNRLALNARGQVIGTSTTPDGRRRGFVWEDGVMTDLGDLRTGCTRVAPRAVNLWGQIVGTCDVGAGPPLAFLWEDGEMRELGPATEVGWPIGINERGQILTWGVAVADPSEVIGRIVTVRR